MTGQAKLAKKELKQKRARETRHRLIECAGELVGEYGYPGCSVARVTAAAEIAHGAFYLHFQSQQELFEEIIPTLGVEMLIRINDAARDARDIFELEARTLRATSDYLFEHPYLYRVIGDGRMFAPDAYTKFNDVLNRGYIRALKRVIDLTDVEEELLPLAISLVGARWRLLFRIGGTTPAKRLPDGAIQTYVEFAANGVLAVIYAARRRERAVPATSSAGLKRKRA